MENMVNDDEDVVTAVDDDDFSLLLVLIIDKHSVFFKLTNAIFVHKIHIKTPQIHTFNSSVFLLFSPSHIFLVVRYKLSQKI